jgi:hypothetical protein
MTCLFEWEAIQHAFGKKLELMGKISKVYSEFISLKKFSSLLSVKRRKVRGRCKG